MNELEKTKLKIQTESGNLFSAGDGDCQWREIETEVVECLECQNVISLRSDQSIHWEGVHWHLKGAFQRAKTKIAELNQKIERLNNDKRFPQKSQLAEDATKFYFEHLEKILELEHIGEFVSIDPESGQYFLGETLGEVMKKSSEAFPDKILFTIKIRYDAVNKFGGSLVPRNYHKDNEEKRA